MLTSIFLRLVIITMHNIQNCPKHCLQIIYHVDFCTALRPDLNMVPVFSKLTYKNLAFQHFVTNQLIGHS